MSRLGEQLQVSFRTFSSGGGGAGGGVSSGGGGGGGGSSGGGSLWAGYLALLERRPVATKAVTAALLNALGDVIAQAAFEKGDSPFNWRRLGVFAFLVGGWVGVRVWQTEGGVGGGGGEIGRAHV